MAGTEQGLDLSVASDLLRYLADTPFAAESATSLTGGMGNYVFRIRLRTPYEGRHTLVAKHAKPYLPGNKSFEFSTSRQEFEAGALKRIASAVIGNSSLVSVPKVHHFDDNAHIIIMDDAGENTQTLKQLLLDSPGTLTPKLATQIGTELGRFIAGLHSWGASDDAAEAREWAAGHALAKRIAIYATYGRLLSTLDGVDESIPDLREPPLDLDAHTKETIAALVEARKRDINDSLETLVMGDFWPGNILVRLSSDGELERLVIVDWELARSGLAGLDVGQFAGDVRVLKQFVRSARECADELVGALLRAYAARRSGQDGAWAGVAAGHVGAHLVVWGSRIPYAGRTRELTRELVEEGVGYLKDSHSWERQWTVEALIHALCSTS
ncbi:unnamed protein product [Peniophora sp. CBMAI 1063]|nr:unnamed protein product [Peniophora sp. CBMAI 1063]